MRYTLIALMFMVTFVTLRGQPRHMPMGREPGAQRFLFVEEVTMPSSDSSHTRVDIHYRIDKQFFVPVKNQDPSFPWEFTRRGDILIELLDPAGSSVARDITKPVIGSNTAESEATEKEWHQGAATFTVRPGLYRLAFEVDDLESDRHYFDRDRTVIVRRFAVDSLNIGDAIIATGTISRDSARQLTVQNFGGDLIFGQNASVLFPVHLTTDSGAIDVVYTIAEEPRPGEPGKTVVQDSNAVSLRGVRLTPFENGTGISYTIEPSGDRNDGVVALPIHSDQLQLRHFMLKAVFRYGASRKPVSVPFQTVWPEMPQSLRDIEYALDALRYITTEQQLDSLKDGSFEEQRDHLENFWQQRNPDKRTAPNPVMTQYYRRVDYAGKSFGTMREPDGSKTDRGRIYILHGAPATIQRSLDPARGYKEVWSYGNPDREFVFVDESKSGNYTLVSGKSL